MQLGNPEIGRKKKIGQVDKQLEDRISALEARIEKIEKMLGWIKYGLIFLGIYTLINNTKNNED
jgi:hypothetical protein